ncbi:MAG: transposase [Myxococcaceae bacterium]|nr:MAG: transposase [Myxococcaceae bacterium]
MGLSRVTVRKYLRAPTCPTRAPRRTKVGTLTGFDTHLRTRWEAGCRDAVVLWQELRTHGFQGTYRTVQRHVAGWRTGEGAPKGTRTAMSAKAPSPRQARWWLTLPSERLSASQRRFVEVLLRDSDRARNAQRLAVAFGRVMRGRYAPALDEWMVEAEASEVVEFRDFVETLRYDVEAVRAAITSPWSNGQTEGQVNKIKMLKRQMYGRASVDLLRQRLLAA